MAKLVETEFLEIDAIADILRKVTFMSLSTCSNGKPWCSPVFYAFDENLNFYWKSSPTSRHSLNITENQNSAVVIYNSVLPDGEGWGVYLEGISSEISDPNEIEKANHTSFERIKRPVEPHDWLLDPNAPRKFYKFSPHKIWSNGVEKIQGKWVDVRKEISLSDLKKAYFSE